MKPEKKAAREKKSPLGAKKVAAVLPKRITRSAQPPETLPRQEAKPARSRAPRRVPTGKKPARETALKVPAILLEGDETPVPSVSGPGQRFALGPTPPLDHFARAEASDELPEAYGTQKLLLAARDPHWLYAHWDFTREQLRAKNRLSSDGHLVLRVYCNEIAGVPITEVHVHPESKNWFVHVGRGATRFIAELGYYAKAGGDWTRLSISTSTLTPPDAVSSDTTVQFATIPMHVPFDQLVAIVRAAISEHVPLAEAILQLRAAGYKKLPGPREIKTAEWTPAQERALAELISMDAVRRVWIGSLEITELVRRQLVGQISSAVTAQFSLPSSPGGAVASITSPFGGVERRKGFWFNINAELIIYGATEPDATVTIGGRVIKLRPDGSFSFRFALPDGHYDLPVAAISADNTDSRAAGLVFLRRTEYRGEVGVHPQDASLKVPKAQNVA